jgi:hypothetical protein
MNNEQVEILYHHHILGLTFDEKLKWKEHIKDVKARALRKLNIIKSLAHSKWRTDQRTLLRIHQIWRLYLRMQR